MGRGAGGRPSSRAPPPVVARRRWQAAHTACRRPAWGRDRSTSPPRRACARVARRLDRGDAARHREHQPGLSAARRHPGDRDRSAGVPPLAEQPALPKGRRQAGRRPGQLRGSPARQTRPNPTTLEVRPGGRSRLDSRSRSASRGGSPCRLCRVTESTRTTGRSASARSSRCSHGGRASAGRPTHPHQASGRRAYRIGRPADLVAAATKVVPRAAAILARFGVRSG